MEYQYLNTQRQIIATKQFSNPKQADAYLEYLTHKHKRVFMIVLGLGITVMATLSELLH